ncbi:o-succinylbenzoate--CoA ligase [Virgibacillus sp. C22-A2]|uniref:2-succinylbenzoate--CoA ligase n=1 Tax=Virgibacillus tibetensis TaxID=3042313 RepID=A0ABU6KJ27_9BACI|nr:o-succinylbenzoate--CoA ligase [Virgibacillus sp. C22-A2]
METIPHWLTKQADLAPSQTAIELPDGFTMTFSELRDESQTYAKKLAGMGVAKGTHVGILSTNYHRMVIAIHALSYLGAVGVLLNIRLTETELNYQIIDAGVSYLLAADSLIEQVMHLDVEKIHAFSEINTYEEKAVNLNTELNLDDTFTIIYTSGTTGFPKGVIHTYGNHWWSAIGSALNLGINTNDKWLATLPLFHVGGLSILIKSVIYGMPVYLLDKFNEDVIHKAIMKSGVTIVSVVTVMLQRLITVAGSTKYPETFRCMLLGGGPAPKSLLEKAKSNHIPVFQTYGMTETSSQIVTLSPKDALEKIGSAGKALFPAQLKVITLENNGIGEIHVKGPMVTKGYLNNKVATEKALHSEWLATGDLGYLDTEGFLYVVGRRNDLIISGGENIYPSEIENLLTNLTSIKEVAVVGKADDRWDQVPVAFVVLNDQKMTESEIISYAQKHLAKYKVPQTIYFVDQLPRNASNKIVKHQLLKLL